MADVSTFRAKVKTIIQDDAGVLANPDELDVFIQEAVEFYSQDKAFEKVILIAGDASADYPVPADWVDGFSLVNLLEFPIGKIPRVFLDEEEDFQVERIVGGLQILLLTVKPSVGDDFNLTYTIPHTVDATSSTVFASDEHAVANLAASRAFLSLSAAMTQTNDSTIQADAIDFVGRAAQYQALATEKERIYRDIIGVSPERVFPALRVPEIDCKPQTGGEYLWITHRSNRR